VRRLVLLTSAILFVETIFFAALAPLLPGFEEELGLSKSQAGLLVAMYALGGIAGAIPGALVASRVGIKPATVAGLLLVTAGCVAFGVVDSYWLLNATRFAQGFGSSFCWTGALAWLISATPRRRRGEMIGIAMGSAIGGALLGPLLGGLASEVGRAPAFGGVAALSLLLAAWALELPAPPQGESQPLRLLLVALRSRRVLVGMWLLMLPALLFGTLGVLAPLQLHELGWSTLGIAATFFVSAGIEASLSPAIGRWSDRRGRLAPIRFGLIAAGAVSLIIPWLDDRWVLSLLVVLAGISYGMFWTPATALLSEGWESVGVEHALGFGLMNFAWAPGHVIGSAAGGGLADLGGDITAYAVLAAVCLTTFAALGQRSLSAAAQVQPSATEPG
jgi:MFS family permease